MDIHLYGMIHIIQLLYILQCGCGGGGSGRFLSDPRTVRAMCRRIHIYCIRIGVCVSESECVCIWSLMLSVIVRCVMSVFVYSISLSISL